MCREHSGRQGIIPSGFIGVDEIVSILRFAQGLMLLFPACGSGEVSSEPRVDLGPSDAAAD